MIGKGQKETLVTEAAFTSTAVRYVLPTNDAPIEFDGEFIDSIDNGGGERLRWAELRLYWWYPADRPVGYILYTIGHTLVYHALDSECNKGVVTRVENFEDVTDEDPADLTACTECNPPDWRDLPDGEELELEVTWYRWVSCHDADELLLNLRKEPRCKYCAHRPHDRRRCYCSCETYEEGDRPLSIPGYRLLTQVKSRDAAIAAAMSRKRTRL